MPETATTEELVTDTLINNVFAASFAEATEERKKTVAQVILESIRLRQSAWKCATGLCDVLKLSYNKHRQPLAELLEPFLYRIYKEEA